MRWTERQRAMLREMGVRMWTRPAAPDGVVAAPDERAGAGAGRGSGKGVAPVLAAATTVAAPTDVARAAAMSAPAAAVPTKPSPCDWLVVGEPFDVGDGAAGEQERLLDNMLQSIGVSRSALTRAARACHVALAEGAAAAAGATAAAGSAPPGAAPASAALHTLTAQRARSACSPESAIRELTSCSILNCAGAPLSAARCFGTSMS